MIEVVKTEKRGPTSGMWRVWFSEPVRLLWLGSSATWAVSDREDPHDTSNQAKDAMQAFQWGQWVISMQDEWEQKYGRGGED